MYIVNGLKSLRKKCQYEFDLNQNLLKILIFNTNSTKSYSDREKNLEINLNLNDLKDKKFITEIINFNKLKDKIERSADDQTDEKIQKYFKFITEQKSYYAYEEIFSIELEFKTESKYVTNKINLYFPDLLNYLKFCNFLLQYIKENE